MRRLLPFCAGLLVAVGATAAWLWWPRREHVAIDLIAALPSARKQTSSPDGARAFAVIDATVGNITKPSIFTASMGRLTWPVTVPARGWLEVALALKEDAWTAPGDGVQFRIGISGRNGYDELLRLVDDPFHDPDARRWQNVLLDLSPYEGQSVSVIFNADSTPPAVVGRPPVDSRANDLALWGAPRIIVR